jgi:hypothetical protein
MDRNQENYPFECFQPKEMKHDSTKQSQRKTYAQEKQLP